MNEETALWLVRNELAKARRQHAPMHSAHEGCALIQEELDELWEVVRRKREARGDAESIENPSAELARLATNKMVDLNLTYARAAEYVLRTSPALARAYREFVLNLSQGA